jgi:hypothetical protein
MSASCQAQIDIGDTSYHCSTVVETLHSPLHHGLRVRDHAAQDLLLLPPARRTLHLSTRPDISCVNDNTSTDTTRVQIVAAGCGMLYTGPRSCIHSGKRGTQLVTLSRRCWPRKSARRARKSLQDLMTSVKFPLRPTSGVCVLVVPALLIITAALGSPQWVRAQGSQVKPRPPVQRASPPNRALDNRRKADEAAGRLIRQVGESGRILAIGENPSERVTPSPEVAPGVAPLLSFRYFDRESRYRLGRLDLVVDDAGH